MSTAKYKWKLRSPIFKDQSQRTGYLKKRGTLTVFYPYRRLNRFQGHLELLKRKENSSRGSDKCLGVCMRCRHTFVSWFRKVDLIPFRVTLLQDCSLASIPWLSPMLLGPTHSRSIAVLEKPFSTSALKILA